MSLDPVKVALVGGAAAVILVIGCACVVLWNNGQSRNLALATSTVVAAAVLLVTQAWFELRKSSSQDFVNVEFVVDRATPQIRAYYGSDRSKGSGGAWRIGAEVRSSEYLRSRDLGAFERDRERLSADFAWFSAVAFLASTQMDWQVERRRFTGPATGSLFISHPVSKPVECATFTDADLHELLVGVGNIFGQAPITVLGAKLCFPPATKLRLSPDQLVISNPFCEISLALEASGGVSYGLPDERNSGVQEQVPAGGARWETRVYGFKVTTTYRALRLQHSDMTKYRAWADRFRSDLHDWFEQGFLK